MTAAPSTSYQVGVFALVRQSGAYLIVHPRRPLLPGEEASLPGLLLEVDSGHSVVELCLRRTLLSQAGLAVGDLRLVGSHAARGTEAGHADARLHLIFGTDYCSGILNPQPADLHGAGWVPRAQLLESGAPGWLQSAVRAYDKDSGYSVIP